MSRDKRRSADREQNKKQHSQSGKLQQRERLVGSKQNELELAITSWRKVNRQQMGNKGSTHRLGIRDKGINLVQQAENGMNKGKHSHPRKQRQSKRG
jgi:hypothetical protein